MADIYCNDGYEEDLSTTLNGTSPAAKYLRLFNNNYTPVLAEVPGDFTECSAAGYAAVALGGWTDATGAGHVSFTHGSVSFVLTAGDTLYGYYVTDGPGAPTKVYWAGRFASAPFTIPSTGGEIDGTLAVNGP